MEFILKIEEGVSVLIEADSLELAKQQYKKLFGKSQIDAPKSEIKTKSDLPKGLSGHLLGLKNENFFSQPRSLNEIKEKLKELTFHYPSTVFPPYLNKLIRDKVLRRFQEIRDNKKMWVYVNH